MTSKNVYEFYQNIANTIATKKRQLIYIPDTKKYKSFCYSIGNQEKNLPELLIFGVKPDDANVLVSALSDLMIENKRPFFDGEEINLGGEQSVTMRNCTKIAHMQYTIQAGQFYGNEDYQVQQILIPDKKGRLPDHPHCHKDYKVPVLKKLEVD